MRGDLLAICAKEKVGRPDAHTAALEVVDEGVYIVRIADAPLVAAGKRAGLPNWRKKTNERRVYITGHQYKAWLAEWVARTGNCPECAGKGEVMHSWHHESGYDMRPCKHCGATGKATPAGTKGEQ